jgi:hypothetical protein
MAAKVNTAERIKIYVGHKRKRYEASVEFIKWFLNDVRQRVAPMGIVND